MGPDAVTASEIVTNATAGARWLDSACGSAALLSERIAQWETAASLLKLSNLFVLTPQSLCLNALLDKTETERPNFTIQGDLAPRNFVLDSNLFDFTIHSVDHLRPKSSLWIHGHLARELWSTRFALEYLASQRRDTEKVDYLHNGQWLHLIVGLFRQIELRNLRIDVGALFEAANYDPRTIYYLLATAFQHALLKREGRLQSQLKISAKLVAAFYSLLLLSFSIRNLIMAQRSWFLYHGSHPTDTLEISTRLVFIKGVSA